MILSSTELIQAAKEALNRMLTRQMEKDMQPSFYDMYYRGFTEGLSQGKEMTTEDISKLNEWHYIKIEGNPPTDDKCWCLIQEDGFKDTVFGWYEEDRDEWHLEWHPHCYHKVIAWHLLPQIPD